MNQQLTESIQKQINFELYSSYLYFSMSCWCEEEGLKGFANWMRVQAQEELSHATYMHDYLLRRGVPSRMLAIDQPPHQWDDILAVVADVLGHEQIVTQRINEISSLALDSKDHAAYQFFMQYIDEQVEEEENARDMLDQVKIATQCSKEMLYTLDREAGTRVFTAPFGTATA